MTTPRVLYVSNSKDWKYRVVFNGEYIIEVAGPKDAMGIEAWLPVKREDFSVYALRFLQTIWVGLPIDGCIITREFFAYVATDLCAAEFHGAGSTTI